MAQMFVVPVADTVLLHFKTAAKAKVDAAVDHVSTSSCFVHHMQVHSLLAKLKCTKTICTS